MGRLKGVTVLRREDGSTVLSCTGMDTSDRTAIVELLHEGISLVTTLIPTGTTELENRSE